MAFKAVGHGRAMATSIGWRSEEGLLAAGVRTSASGGRNLPARRLSWSIS